MKPYNEMIVGQVSYRTFKHDVDEMELVWHRDAEDRIVEAQHETDWMFQFDNELPITFNDIIHIPKDVIHRVIKGTGDLQLRIVKHVSI
jgi:hypothetical protein